MHTIQLSEKVYNDLVEVSRVLNKSLQSIVDEYVTNIAIEAHVNLIKECDTD